MKEFCCRIEKSLENKFTLESHQSFFSPAHDWEISIRGKFRTVSRRILAIPYMFSHYEVSRVESLKKFEGIFFKAIFFFQSQTFYVELKWKVVSCRSWIFNRLRWPSSAVNKESEVAAVCSPKKSIFHFGLLNTFSLGLIKLKPWNIHCGFWCSCFPFRF